MSTSCVRKIYLVGGASIWIYPNNKGTFLYNLENLKGFEFDILSNEKLFIDLRKKFNIQLEHLIGMEIFQLKEQLDNKMLPFWEIFTTEGGQTLPRNNHQAWSNLSNTAFREKNSSLWDLSSKISNQLATIKHGLNNLAHLYNVKLDSKVELNDFELNEAFQNSHTYPIYYQFQHILMDCSILRDYLSEFINEYVLENRSPKKIDSMGQLFKQRLINENNSDFERYLCEINKKDNWLNQLSAYRDLVVHSAPLVNAKRRLFTQSSKLELLKNLSIPIIKCPLPNNPHEIREIRRDTNFKDFEKRLEYYIGDLNEPNTKDCLTYSKELINNISTLCQEVIKFSPIEPEITHFTQKDMTGEIKITMK